MNQGWACHRSSTGFEVDLTIALWLSFLDVSVVEDVEVATPSPMIRHNEILPCCDCDFVADL